MITNLEKNFEALRAKQFVEDYKAKNKRKEKSCYFNPVQKLWVLTSNKEKAEQFVKDYEATLPKKKEAKDLKVRKVTKQDKVEQMIAEGYTHEEIAEKLLIKVGGVRTYISKIKKKNYDY